ncbi:50S ribosomal protein L11 methyltransferase [Glaciecola petra]|uniref:Ribosomal protein L11 methyltransferase n=1 Tax=Glaciecola petra TaxID=3075602 RepID=A0ABU2ZRF9_9ALTE|nr:50S ribosomal protein L11 methyltransferase [Aestuariibacter sp. P117]MDT0595217.1 50S ribosomal protein L11 methyltransferase [Aestuariibacter sp. P117]
MAWQQIKISLKGAYAETISDILETHGAQAVTFVDAKDTPVYEPKPGEVLLWPDTQVIGLYDASEDLIALKEQIIQAMAGHSDCFVEFDQLEEKNWEREWMKDFHPMQFGDRLWICPSWQTPPDPNAVNIKLDPGLAFGTGTHPTTSLCLQWLDATDLAGKTVVDFGCGSGVLSLAALMLGASKVIGIDIDPQALIASKDNAQRNGVDDRLSLYLTEHQPSIQADVVLANILAAPLKSLSNTISDFCRPGGKLLMSGILLEQQKAVEAHYSDSFVFAAPAIEGEWLRLNAVKNS